MSFLAHHGILGMKWGIRRFQNKDGSLTPAGRKHKDSSIKDYINDSYKNKYHEKYDAEGQKILKKYGRFGGLTRKGEKKYLDLEDKKREEIHAESYRHNKTIMSDKEIASDVAKVRTIQEKFFNSPDYDTKLEKQYFDGIESIGKKIVNKFASDIPKNEYGEYVEQGQSIAMDLVAEMEKYK